jgi:phosphate transport system substrate-binding protein
MYKAFFVIFPMVTLLGCKDSPENGPTYGKAKIVADETLYPIVDALEKAFEHTYQRTAIEVVYLPEAAAFNAFYNDSAEVIICAKQLDEKEAAYFRSKKLNPRTALLANDALALLFSPSNVDTAMTCEQTTAMFKGEITDWRQIGKANKSGPIQIVFDHQGSSTVGYFMKMAGESSPPAQAYAKKTTQAVVDYVAQNPNALGVVGYSWLSDDDDPLCRELRAKCRVASISPRDNQPAKGFYQPLAENVLESLYPFSRQVFAINRETSNGTGTGFVAFMAGEVGQRIISKAGILPAYKVEHHIELKSEPFKVTD